MVIKYYTTTTVKFMLRYLHTIIINTSYADGKHSLLGKIKWKKLKVYSIYSSGL